MQESNYLKLVDSNYRLRASKQYHLNVRLSGNSFSYNIFDPEQQKFMALFDTRSGAQQINIAPYLEEDDLLKQAFGRTRLLFTSEQFLLLPDELYEEDKIEGLMEKTFSKPAGVLVKNHLPLLKAWLIAGLSSGQREELHQYFPEAALFHEGTPFISGLQRQYESNEQSFLSLHVENRYMELAFLLNSKLQFYNRFCFENAEQFIYFPLFVCKQLGLEPKEVNLLLSGVIDEHSDYYRQLLNYFRHLDFLDLPGSFNYSKRLYDIPQHYFYSLINLELCE